MTPNQDARATESVALREAIRGVTSVSFGLLRECLGPLEVSAALIESDDSEQLDALIDKVKAALAAYDSAQSGSATPEQCSAVAESAEQRAVPAGFVMVPVELTDAMCEAVAVGDEGHGRKTVHDVWQERWAAMLAAAPAAQQAALTGLTHEEAVDVLRFGASSKAMADAITRALAAKNNLQLRDGGE